MLCSLALHHKVIIIWELVKDNEVIINSFFTTNFPNSEPAFENITVCETITVNL